MPLRIDISVIIVSYNCLDALMECLASVTAQAGVSHETIVVDNASLDGTREYLNSSDIRKFLSDRNLGFGAGVNLGLSMAEGEYLFILNPDTILPPGTLKALHDFASNRSHAGLISPLIVSATGEVQRSARGLPRRRDFVFGRGSLFYILGITSEKRAGYIQENGSEPIQVPAASATAAFVPSKLFRSLGGFDPRFFMYLEDIDLCKRIGERGLEIWLLPAVKVAHRWRQSSKNRPYFTSYHHHLSVLKYFLKHNPHQPLRNALMTAALTVGFLVSSLFISVGWGKGR